MKHNQIKGIKYSRALKKRATKAELKLKKTLENNDIWFKFQAFFFDHNKVFIPDFRLATQHKKLIIEVDGKSHDSRQKYDNNRTQWLQTNRNCHVIRFTNDEVIDDIDNVLQKILAHKPLTMTKHRNMTLKHHMLQKINDLDLEFAKIVSCN